MDQPQVKKIICCFKDTYVWLAAIIFGFILFAARIVSYFIKPWYYQGSDLKKWKGSLFEVYQSGGYIDKKFYPLLSEYYCAEKSTFSSENTTSITYNDADRLCQNFYSLTGGFTAFLFFSILGLIFWIILLTLLIFNKRLKKRHNCSLVFSILQLICEFSSLIAVSASVNLTLQDDCNYLSTSDNLIRSSVCGDNGCLISILISLFTLAYHIWMFGNYCGLYCCIKPYIENVPEQRNVELSNRYIPNAQIEEEKFEKEKKIVDYPD